MGSNRLGVTRREATLDEQTSRARLQIFRVVGPTCLPSKRSPTDLSMLDRRPPSCASSQCKGIEAEPLAAGGKVDQKRVRPRADRLQL